MEMTERIGFRAAPDHKEALALLAWLQASSEAEVLRRLIRKEALRCGFWRDEIAETFNVSNPYLPRVDGVGR